MTTSSIKRSSEIDFLRGIAVILVIFRHFPSVDVLREMGWIGVDLFFVLSGFLVSGLLFKEYQESKSIDGIRFLIRRGFKIYPVFYSFILFTIAWKLASGISIQRTQLMGELFFLQNYIGSFWNHTWSLAVEEHFYFFLTFIVYLTSKFKKTESSKLYSSLFLSIALTCLLLRVYTNLKSDNVENLYYSHLRFDSLFFGVWLSHQYRFNRDAVINFISKNKSKMILMAFSGLCFTPIIKETESFFIKTIGFTLIYLAFGSILLLTLRSNIQQAMTKFRASKIFYHGVSTIGFYSYSIYIIHIMVSIAFTKLEDKYHLPNMVAFIGYFIVSVICGVMISKTIEIPFLNLREKKFPKSKTNQSIEQSSIPVI